MNIKTGTTQKNQPNCDIKEGINKNLSLSSRKINLRPINNLFHIDGYGHACFECCKARKWYHIGALISILKFVFCNSIRVESL